MSEPVKRHYTSQLREAQARETRRAIVNAAARLFVERGYGATTIDAVAEAAGVSRKTVFTSVGGKVELLKLAIDWTIVGDDEPVPLQERAPVRQARQELDSRKIIADFGEIVLDVGRRFARLHRVVEGARGSDSAVAALAEEAARQRRAGMQGLAELLKSRRALKRGLSVDEAADILWLFNDPSVYHRLVLDRGWSEQRYLKWLTDTVATQLLK